MKKFAVGLSIVVLAGAGSIAAAQGTTTSADLCVKPNGQIRLATDGSCSVGEALVTIEGAEGPPGADGQDGVDGEDGVDGQDGQDGVDGQDGQDGVSGYEIVRQLVQWGGGGFQRAATVACPTGKRALGAGWRIPRIWFDSDDDEFGFDATENRPSVDGSAWQFNFWGDWSGAVTTVELSVTCASV